MIKGLKIIKTIQSTDRFDSYEAELNGQKVFAKKAKNEKARELLAGLSNNSAIVNRLGAKSDFNFRAPQVHTQKGNWIITEWIDGKSLGENIDLEPEFVADVLAEFFIAFDNEPIRPNGFRQIFTKDGLANRMDERIPRDLGSKQKNVLVDAKRLFNELKPSLVPALQDADIKPDHVFPDHIRPDSYVLVDSEHLSTQWPRFFDLGNNFSKFWMRGQKKFSNTLLDVFLDKSSIDKNVIFRPMLATIIVRGIALHWETDYDPGAESYNVPRAQEMLKVCLKARNLDDLLY